ncbi:MAG: (Fe-S)-binding protein [Chloroflexota bacterium]
MKVVNPVREVADVLVDEGGKTFELCYQCGLCAGSCPWNLVRSFLPRKLIHEVQLGLVDLESEDMWLCASCRACVQVCPRGVEIIDVMRACRRAIAGLGAGKVPDSLSLAVKSIAATGNPLGEPEENRADWAKDLGVKQFIQGTELLYFPGCYPSYDPVARKVARAIVGILKTAGIDFGILGTKETCCGESVRKTGNEELFRSLAQKNITNFRESGVKSVLVGSPHCYHTFKNEYPEFGSDFEVIHTTQYLLGLIKNGKLKFTKGLNKKVIYHDPCYLGRHNNIFDEPREILHSIPGVQLIEFPDSREDSLCCGGGAGRVWMETKKGERFSDIKIEQALELGAEVLAVACPYCLAMFGDSRLTIPNGESIELKDIAELVWEAI